MDNSDPGWQRKGATLSDKTARVEFGLTQDEISQAIRAGMLHCREGSMYGNPWLRLLRQEAGPEEARQQLPEGPAGEDGVGAHNRELRRLKGQIARLEDRMAKPIAASAK
jgi:hypothetical protein